MKKLKLEAFEISAGARLTREQLRNVVGGSEGGHCQTVADCGTGYTYQCINYVCVVSGGTGSNSCPAVACPSGWHCLVDVHVCVVG
ncbi:hypothetical protein [Mucilaginibacter xinganensis]|uniref:Uncharacterized protein n=1 Tax=Mucilaginibacter xinganensis TaxID=1234841 RepID=A0A223P3S9_9SPHI|nr:hypothetical protein [Mucilaginibacter xinganensis]ASU36755.1 hypothetical protein MuYL_4872 [Mucilaginibacter xinganensis]